jgi:carbon storage regulator
MLVLTRSPNQSVVIDGGIKVTVISVRGEKVRLGFEAPDHVGIVREEILDELAEEPDPGVWSPS